MIKKVIVIGGGAAGMMASIAAAREGAKVDLFEKNEKLGKKIYITGKGRCNITNACDMDELLKNIVTNKSFLYSAFYGLTNDETISFFEKLGLQIKIERGNRVFPVSDHASDVISTLSKELQRLNVNVHLLCNIKKIQCKNGSFDQIFLEDGKALRADACIIATGGLTYASTGSTGDGYRFAKELGHTVTELSPALTGIHTKEDYMIELEGLSLKNINFSVSVSKNKLLPIDTLLINKNNADNTIELSKDIKLIEGKKKKKLVKEGKIIYQGFGEMLFTHFGVSGPLVLSASSYLSAYINDYELLLHLDLKPALTKEELDARILRDFEEKKNKYFKNVLDQLLPQKLIHVIIKRSGINGEKKVNAITKEERLLLVNLLKDLTFEVKSLGGYHEAVITKGGVCVKEVNPSTMESKLVKNIYFTGEVLDVDALTGGFNLQIAWSTGYLAGISSAK